MQVENKEKRVNREDDSLLIRSLFNKLSLKSEQEDPNINHILENLPTIVDEFNTNNPELIFKSTTAFRRLLSFDKSPIDHVINSGVVPKLTMLLCEQLPQLQFEAACVLTNIAAGTTEQTRVVVDNRGIQRFTILLRSQFDQIREQAVWGLGNIGGDSAVVIANATRYGTPHQVKYIAIEQGCIKPVCGLFNISDIDIINIAFKAIDNILMVGKFEEKSTGFDPFINLIQDAIGGIDQFNILQQHKRYLTNK